MEIKITRREKLYEQNNDMVHNWYFLIKGRIINDECTKMKKFRFVVWFDVWDLLEWLGNDSYAEQHDNKALEWMDFTYTQEDIRNYLDELIFCCFTDSVKSYEDCAEFYELCNTSIERYNSVARHW